jgi:hypothetical protein
MRQVGWIYGGGPSGGDGAMGEIVDALGLIGLIGGRWLVGDEGTAGRLDGDGAGAGKGVVGVADGVEVNAECDGDLSHGGHFLAGLQDAGADGAEDLIADLDVDWNAGWFNVQGVDHLYAYMPV